MLMVHVSNPDQLAAEVDKLLQLAFEYGLLQDDTTMVSSMSDDSNSEDEQVCAVMRSMHPKCSKGEERCCFMCGRVGHITCECPQCKEETHRGHTSHGRGENGVFCLSMCGSVPLQFLMLSVNGVRMQALMDSGAQVSVMSEEFF